MMHSIYCGVRRTHLEGGSTCIKRMLRMKSWLADFFMGAKPKEACLLLIVWTNFPVPVPL